MAAAAWAADASQGWGLLPPGGTLAALGGSIELSRSDNHVYHAGGALTDPYHHDRGSLVTMVVMLGERAEYEGGDLQFLESDGSFSTMRLDQGEAIVFPAHKYHSLSRVASGRRSVLIFEMGASAKLANEALESIPPLRDVGTCRVGGHGGEWPARGATELYPPGGTYHLDGGALRIVVSGRGCMQVHTARARFSAREEHGTAWSFGEAGLLRSLLRWLLLQSSLLEPWRQPADILRWQALLTRAEAAACDEATILTAQTQVSAYSFTHEDVTDWLASLGEATVERVAQELAAALGV